MQKEIFKDVPNYEGLYQVSNLGNVKTLGYNKEKILKQFIGSAGYYKVSLTKDKKPKGFDVHKLVAMAFLGHVPDGTNKIVVDHINDIKTDNRVENLQLISNRENSSKKPRGKSKYVGVYWMVNTNKWGARIRINGKRPFLGYFDTELEAHLAYQKALKEVLCN